MSRLSESETSPPSQNPLHYSSSGAGNGLVDQESLAVDGDTRGGTFQVGQQFLGLTYLIIQRHSTIRTGAG
ncbi:hypothetical protein [Rhodococcus sp. BS-15]|uniref:hypothetical protein n=1 Tax=Rhodococcus sp. BS-15 TaxID=1304954 RepID=UPI000B24147D|nr:hypothetical protein [Rhodococcus sp. BS-15]